MATGECALTLSFSSEISIRISAKGGCDGESSSVPVQGVPRILNRDGVRCISSLDEVSVEEPIQVYIGSDGFLPPLLLLENVRYMVELKGKPETIFEYLKKSDASSLEERTLADGSPIYYLQFRGYVGKGILDAKIDNGETVKIPFEVRSRKVDYLTEYPQMLSDIAEFSTALLMSVKSPLYSCYGLSDSGSETVYEDFIVLDYIFSKLDFKGVYQYVRGNPHSELVACTEIVPAGLVSEIDPADLVQLVCEENLIRMDGGPLAGNYVPAEVSERIWEDSYDTPENRLVKDLVLTLDGKVSQLILANEKSKSGYIENRLKDMSGDLNKIVCDPWLADIGEMRILPHDSSVLRSRYGYADLFHMYLILGLGAMFKQGDAENLLEGQNKKMHMVYEYWCYTRLFKCLSDMAEELPEFPIKPADDDGWTLTIDKCSHFIIPVGGSWLDVSLYYNKGTSEGESELTSYSVELRPDFTLVIRSSDTSGKGTSGKNLPVKVSIINFDAKYKSKPYKEKDLDVENPKSDAWEYDICKMHTYRDALINSRGSYVLFPGGTSCVYKKPQGQQSLKPSGDRLIPSVGAISLTPGDDEMVELRTVLRRVLGDIAGITENGVDIEDLRDFLLRRWSEFP